MTLLLFYAYQNPETPRWAKNIVLGALGYLLNPFDCIADITPVIGYTDDIGVLTFALVSISTYISDEAIINARRQLNRWWGDLDMESVHSVEKDRKSTRLNSSHVAISYAVFCLKKKK